MRIKRIDTNGLGQLFLFLYSYRKIKMENKILHHLAKCDLSFLQNISPEVLALKKKIREEEEILKNIALKDWLLDMERLEKYFSTTLITNNPIAIDKCTIINDYLQFVESHLSIAKANNGKEKFKPYLDRLESLYLLSKKI